MVKVLIVDDDRDILKVLSAHFELEGYEVALCESGFQAFEMVKREKPDVIILDLNLPDVDGIQLCTRLRKEKLDVPIIMLTARDTVSDKVLGLECGADDYIVKPFNFLELLARVKSCLRRYRNSREETLKYKSIEIFPEKREVFIDGVKVEFTKTQYELLKYLVKNSGRVCSRKEIKENLWKDKEIYDWSRTIDVHITKLRKKLPKEVKIKTVSGIGYILE